jgi:trans-aconitate 2-methyltransferase
MAARRGRPSNARIASGPPVPAAATAMTSEHYTFGDNDNAAARLTLLARVYEPTSRRFLGALRQPPPERAVDLGCGPGYSTALLHEVVAAGETWGLDASERLVARARGRTGSAIKFAVHDAVTSPWPVADVEVIYARHLFAHLAAPKAAFTACAAAARMGARLLIEETGALDSPDPIFTDYYAHVRALQSHYGQDTFVGRRLDRIAEGTPWKVERFECVRVLLDASSMATLHALNLRTWSHDAFAVSAFDSRTLASIGEALEATAAGERAAPPVACEVGQAVLTR